MTPHRIYKRWPEATRERLRTLHAEGRSIAESIEVLYAETGERVPMGTAGKWATRPPASQLVAGDLQAQIRGVAERIVELLSQDLARLERTPRKALDLERADKIAKTLRTLDAVTPGRPIAERGARTVAELAPPELEIAPTVVPLRPVQGDESA